MKRTLFSICALVAVLVGCSKSDVVDAPNIDTPISFDVYSGKVPVSKATSINDVASLDGEGGFRVYAYKPNGAAKYGQEYKEMEGGKIVEITNDATSAWSFADGKPIYWPQDSENLTFIAHSNNAGESATPVFTYNQPEGESSAPSLSISIPQEIDHQKDILVATNNVLKADAANVGLHFEHILSRVYFEVQSNRALTINSVILSGKFYEKASYDLELKKYISESYTGYTDSFSGYTISSITYNDSDDSKEVGEVKQVGDYLMLLPGMPEESLPEIEVKYSFDGEQTEYTKVVPLDFTFAEGKSYRFTMTIMPATIGFTVTVDNWSDAENVEITKELISDNSGTGQDENTEGTN